MGHGDDEIIKNIKKGDYSFKKPVWKIISPEAKLIITEMIERNPEKRPEMEQIMKCDWIRKSLKK